MSKKPLYVKLDENYKNFEKSLLDEKKEKLAKLRDLNKPIDVEEIKEHERKHLEKLKEL